MSGLVKILATTSEPVTRAEAQLYARYEEGEVEDDLFDTFIIVGREQVEAITEHQLNTATFLESASRDPDRLDPVCDRRDRTRIEAGHVEERRRDERAVDLGGLARQRPL